MHPINRDILIELNQNKQNNYLLSPLWIIKSETIFHKGKYFAKLFIYKNTHITKEITGIQIQVLSNNVSFEIDVFDLKPVESYKDKNMFGVVVELPKDYYEGNIQYKIHSYFTSTGQVKIIQSLFTSINLTSDQLNEAKNKFLRDNLNFTIFPNVQAQYWQCSCGKYNSNEDALCTNCSNHKHDIELIVNKGIDNIIIEKLYNDFPLTSLKAISSSLLTDYYNIFTKYEIAEETITNFLNSKNFSDEYLKVSPINISLSLDADQNISDYITPLVEKGLNTDIILNTYTQSEIELRIKKLSEEKSKSNKKQRTLMILGFSIAFLTIFYFLVGGKLINYGLAHYHLNQSNYDQAIQYFTSSEGLFDSIEMIDESNYLKALEIFPDQPEASIDIMKDLSSRNFKDAKTKYSDFVYEYGVIFFDRKDYSKAIEWFKKVPGDRAALKINQSYYDQAKQFWNSNMFKEAINNLQKISVTYLDSAELLNKYKYEYSNNLIKSKNYEEAILILRSLKDYENSADLLKSATYDHATHYLNIKEYQRALSIFQSIKGYKDVNAKILNIENIIYTWNIRIVTNSYETLRNDVSTLSKYDKWYFNIEVTGGKPNGSLRLRYIGTFPDGSTLSDKWDHDFYDGTTSWANFYWTNPAYGQTGTFTFRVYNSTTGKLIATKTIRIN